MMGLDGDNCTESHNFNQHEIEVLIIVLEDVLVMTVLAHHRQLGFRLNLLDLGLDLSECSLNTCDFSVGCGQAIFAENFGSFFIAESF